LRRHLAGFYSAVDIFRDAVFDRAKQIVLDGYETNDAATICKMMPEFPADFPRASMDAHQVMLDVSDGTLRFRMRLYNSFGYSATLGVLSEPLRAFLEPSLPKRVLIEYQTTGIREVLE
jgi:hypothetical protein